MEELILKWWPVMAGVSTGGAAILYTIILFVSRKEAKFEANRRLFNPEDGSLIYQLSEDAKTERLAISKEILDMKKDMDDNCVNNQEGCQKMVCLKITNMEKLFITKLDGMSGQLQNMDEARADAKGDTADVLSVHAEDIKGIGKEVAKMGAQIDGMAEQLKNGG